MSKREVQVDLTGQTALVTGAGRGIGRAVALSLAQSGARVVAVSRTIEDLEALKEEIEADKGECMIETCDVSEIKQIRELVQKLKNVPGRIDLLVNSAGINILNHTLEVTEEDWDTIMDTNLKGTFFMCQGVAEIMKEHGGGKIINLTSQMAFVGYYDRAVYCASKGGVTQATKAMAVELVPHNIRVNCIAPTYIKTPMTAPMFENQAFLEEVKRRMPLGEIGEPRDVTGAVLYLASDSANMMTGSSVVVDGGWIAW